MLTCNLCLHCCPFIIKRTVFCSAVVLPAVYKTENYTTRLGFKDYTLSPLTTPVNINDTITVEAEVTNAVSDYNIGVRTELF